MSWLARSISNTLRLDDEDEDEAPPQSNTHNDAVSPEDPPTLDPHRLSHSNNAADDDSYGSSDDRDNQGRGGGGVKEDLSELKESFTRQLWGVASFLAPPPPPPPPPPLPNNHRSVSLRVESEAADLVGSGNDDEELEEEGYDARELGQFDEVGNLSQLEDYRNSNENDRRDEDVKLLLEEEEEAVGITEEVLAFARNIAHHPETWLDFPLSEEDEFDDFDMSDAQYKHALAVEYLAPRLSALRIELCPAHMGEGYFWMIYFVLLHSRLNKHDANLLSSPQIVEARALWMQELQKRTKEESNWLGMNTSHVKESEDSPRQNSVLSGSEDSPRQNWSQFYRVPAENVIEKHPPNNEVEFIDKSVIKEDPVPDLEDKEMVVNSNIGIPKQAFDYDEEEEDDDWLKDDSDLIANCDNSIIVNEEDISFSDLEDDTDCTTPVKSK